MKISIDATAKEFADLIHEVQDRQVKTEVIQSPPVHIHTSDKGGYGGWGGGVMNYPSFSCSVQIEDLEPIAQALTDIERSFSSLCTLIENSGISLTVKGERSRVFSEPALINGAATESPVETME